MRCGELLGGDFINTPFLHWKRFQSLISQKAVPLRFPHYKFLKQEPANVRNDHVRKARYQRRNDEAHFGFPR